MLRDYNKHPLNITKNGVNSEKPYKEDLEYLYIQCNLSGKELSFYFNTSIPTIKRWLKFFNIQKSKKLKTLKIKNTCLKKYGKSHFNNRKKSEQTCLKKYGVKNISQVSFIQNKKYKTMKINNTFGSSKEENTIYKILCEKYGEVKRQYKSEKYPFRCDFYIPSEDLYIEYQGFFTHGKEPYNKNNPLHQEKIKVWKSKNSKFYNNAIITWTKRDFQKREIAKNNHLNWLEFFTLNDFLLWINNK